MPRGLPFEYPVRNLGRRPARTLLTGTACALVAAVLVAAVAFVRGLDRSFAAQGRSDTAIILSSVSQRDVLRSTVLPATGDLVAADVAGVLEVNGVPAVSTEIHMGTRLRLGEAPPPADAATEPSYAAFVRGVTDRAFLVHEIVTLVEGRLPGPGEVLVGRLVPEKLRVDPARLAIGRTLRFEGAAFTVAGTFAAPGTTIESEIWAPLHELKGHARRDDSSAVFVRVAGPEAFENLSVFANRRLDLEVEAIPTRAYYREVAAYFGPIKALAFAMAILIGTSVVFTGANTLNTSVQDRLSELATLRALGYTGTALATALLTEALLLGAAGALAGLVLARLLIAGTAFRISMGAFVLEVDGQAVLIGFAGVLALVLIGTVPALVRVLRLPVATALKER